VPPSVHSTGITASAPAGIGAPVMIRAHIPPLIASTPEAPAAMSPITGSVTGDSAEAVATSAATTA
jgi:hypothetical protein